MAKPTEKQLEWANCEIGVIIHYDIQVFKRVSALSKRTGRLPAAEYFAPTMLSAEDWVQTARDAGAKYAVLVVKHCTGFSLWDTKVHDYNSVNSPCKTDILKDFIDACRSLGIKPGIYYSLACNYKYGIKNGRHIYGNKSKQRDYYDSVRKQLEEIWGNYGELFELWFDGGILSVENGGVDISDLYNKLQPNAIKFQGSAISKINNLRWSGNEEGYTAYDTYSSTRFIGEFDGTAEVDGGIQGSIDGDVWAPVECDMPNRRRQWFYEKKQDKLVISADELLLNYFNSVGRNANLLLGMVVDDRGLIPDKDKETFKKFGTLLSEFKRSAVYETDIENNETYEFDGVDCNYVELTEDLRNGHTIDGYTVYCRADGVWKECFAAKVIGHKRIHAFEGDVNISGFKINATAAGGKTSNLHMKLIHFKR